MALRALRLESLLDSPQAYGSTYGECLEWTSRRWRQVAREWNYFLAERAVRGVGIASGGPNDRYPGTRWLYGMYVTPKERGTGVAEVLVDAVQEWARQQGSTSLYLHVAAPMQRARAFYEREGFRATGDVVAMERDPSILLTTMVKSLA
jgi:GNAT superfamily N-acetyltransferase